MIVLKPNKFYLYHHLIPNTNTVFYVGVGRAGRVCELHNAKRSDMWRQQYKNTGVQVEIVGEFSDKKEACNAEIKEIDALRTKGHPLVNITNGGQGMLGVEPWNKGMTGLVNEKITKANKIRFSSKESRVQQSINCGGSGRVFQAISVATNSVEWQGLVQAQCAYDLGIGQGTISKCLSGYQKTYRGYSFKYIGDKS